jgi:uncharacterized protein (DUF736 family)
LRLSSPDLRSFLARQETRHPSSSANASAASGAAASVPAFGSPIETAIGRFDPRKGTSSWQPSAPSRRRLRIIPQDTRTNDNAPSHRVLVNRAEIGAAWSKTSNEGRDYLAVKLDDPSFNAPIYANLFDDEGGESFSLIWSRPNGRRSDG